METEIVVSKRFRRNTQKIYDYILQEHSAKTAYQFLDRLQHRVEFISRYPETGKPSQKKANIRSLSLQPHNRIFYRLTSARIEWLCLFDMRRNKQPY